VHYLPGQKAYLQQKEWEIAANHHMESLTQVAAGAPSNSQFVRRVRKNSAQGSAS